MHPNATWLLLALVALMLIVVVPRIRVFLILRGLRLSPVDAPDDAALAAVPLLPFEQAAVDELQGWGFERVRDGFERLEWEPTRMVYFAHRELPHFARLQLRGTPYSGLPVTFVSFDAQGAPIATVNRVGWAFALGCDSLHVLDARVDSVEAQWAVHRERAAHAATLARADAIDRIEAISDRDHAQSLATGRWVQGRHFVQPSLRSAWRTTAALMADRRLLQRPFDSAATRGESAASFLAAMLEQQERQQSRQRTERLIKLALLAATLAIAWLLWGVLFDWTTACQLIVILLVHEMGHALAMRAFGWTNLQIFFIPLLGAVATGGRPHAPAAWKDVVMLLAGPLPGLLAGMAVMSSTLSADATWHSWALMAIAINAFNLLPLAPLDGGQLMAIAVFNRWPYARLAFTLASAIGIAVVGWKLEAPAAWFIALMLALGWRRELRVASIERRVPLAGHSGSAIADVCAAVCDRQPALGLIHRSGLAQLVLRRRQVPRAGLALGLVVVLGLGAMWGVVAKPLVEVFTPDTRPARTDPRSSAQRDFDKRWREVAFTATAASSPPNLDAEVARLGPDDRRRRDADWLRTQALPPTERASAVASWIAAGDGLFMSHQFAAGIEVNAQVDAAVALDPVRRVEAMRALVGWTGAQGVPRMPRDVDVIARLRLAEATDLAGDEPGARRMLDEIVGAAATAASRSSCECGLPQALEARAWFEMTHDRPLEAIRVLDGPVARTLGKSEPQTLGVARAWAFRQAGDAAAGLDQLKAVLHADDLDADFQPRHKPANDDDDDFEPWNAPDLAAALDAAGHHDEARHLCRSVGRNACEEGAGMTIGVTVGEGPWQARHARERAAVARVLLEDRPNSGKAVRARAPASTASAA